MSAPDLGERVLAVVLDRGPVSGNAVARAVRRRREDVSAALSAYERAGAIRDTPAGWIAAGNGRESAHAGRPAPPERALTGAAAVPGSGSRPERLVGGPCTDSLACRYWRRYPVGPWSCASNHSRTDGSAPEGRAR